MDRLIIGLLAAPVVYLIVLGTLLVRRKTEGIRVSVAFAILTPAIVAWSIFRADASDSYVVLLGLPSIGAVAGLLGLVFGRWRARRDRLRLVFAWGSLAIVLFYIYPVLVGGMEGPEPSRGRDRESAAFWVKHAWAKHQISAGLSKHRGTEAAYLDSLVRSRINDRPLVAAAANNRSTPPGILDTLAKGSDSTIVRRVARNRSTSAETLSRIYLAHPSQNYLLDAVASNQRTPPDILLEIAATSRDRVVIYSLLRTQLPDCALLSQLDVTLKAMPPDSTPTGTYYRNILKELKPKTCSGAPAPRS